MPLRRLLLYMARQPGLRRWVESGAATRRLAKRFIAGSTLDEALVVCRTLKSDGITATLDYLGENVTSSKQAEGSRDMALRTLRALQADGLEPNISIKLSQFGLDISTEVCEGNVSPVVELAAAIGGFVRIDTESSAYTERTISLVTRLHSRYAQCGTVMQAYLRRTADDVGALIAQRVRVRLCKGAYLEPPELAFADKAEVDRNYVRLAEVLLERGHYPAIATHDERIIAELCRFVSDRTISKDAFEFQMLYGIRRDLQKKLVGQGFRLRVYVPFGEAWYPYFMRRLAERPANLLFFVRNLMRS